MSGLQNGKGRSANQARDIALGGQESSRSHPVGQCEPQSSRVLPHASAFRTVPLNSISISREILSADAAMMACAFAVAQPVAALRPCARKDLAGHQRVPPPRFAGSCVRVVHHNSCSAVYYLSNIFPVKATELLVADEPCNV